MVFGPRRCAEDVGVFDGECDPRCRSSWRTVGSAKKKGAHGHKMMGVVLREQLQLISANHNISNIYQIHIYICIIN